MLQRPALLAGRFCMAPRGAGTALRVRPGTWRIIVSRAVCHAGLAALSRQRCGLAGPPGLNLAELVVDKAKIDQVKRDIVLFCACFLSMWCGAPEGASYREHVVQQPVCTYVTASWAELFYI